MKISSQLRNRLVRTRRKIVKRIADIDPAEWHRIFPKDPEGYHFFKTIDESSFDGINAYYVLIYKKNVPICAAPFFIMDYPLDTTMEGKLKDVLTDIRRVFPGFFSMRAIICGCVACEGRVGIFHNEKEAAVKAVIRAMEKLAKKEKASMLAFKDFSADQTPALDLLLKHDFSKIESYPSLSLNIDFMSFHDYLASLSRSTRKDLKRKFAKADSLDKIDFEVRENLNGLEDEAYQLYLQTLNKSRVKFEVLPREFFTSIARNMTKETKYFLWFINGRLVAFNLCLVTEKSLIDAYIGMDYSIALKHHLYFVTFRDVVNWCIKTGVKKYETGALSYEPKKRLGCSFIPNYIYARHKSSLLNPFFKFMCTMLKPSNFDRVLKEMKTERLMPI